MIGDILQPSHLLLLLIVALLVLGPKRLPEVARSLGRGMHEFRQTLSLSAGDDNARAGALEYRDPDADQILSAHEYADALTHAEHPSETEALIPRGPTDEAGARPAVEPPHSAPKPSGGPD
ncbi:MAG: twin-arginine translocase TatA/TatE family subunit [Solirubrobacteraceae bacterium]